MAVRKAGGLLDAHLVDGRLNVMSLCGVPLVTNGPAKTRGVAVLLTDGGRFGEDGLACKEFRSTATGAAATHVTVDGRLKLETEWLSDPGTGVVSRRDALVNTGSGPVTILRCLPRVSFPTADYEIYSQQSRWSHENQGAWQPLHAGETVLRCVWGRSAQGGTPYACIRNVRTREGLVFHVVPRGNWMIRVSVVPDNDNPPCAVVDLGLSDENLRLKLAPGQRFALPEILIQVLPGG